MKGAKTNVYNAWFWMLTFLAALGLFLVFANVLISQKNQDIRAEISERQKYINQSVQLNKLNNQIIQRLAYLAATKNDVQLKQLLADHGINYTLNQAKDTSSGAKAIKAKSTSK
jgi:hypothetical protein